MRASLWAWVRIPLEFYFGLVVMGMLTAALKAFGAADMVEVVIAAIFMLFLPIRLFYEVIKHHRRKAPYRWLGTALVIVCLYPVFVFMREGGPDGPAYQAKARQSEAKIALLAIYGAEKAYFDEYKTYVASFDRIGYAPESARRLYIVGFPHACVPPDVKPEQARTPMLNSKFGAGRENEIEDFFRSVKTCREGGFEAYAVGVIREGGVLDVWKIDETRTLVNLKVGI